MHLQTYLGSYLILKKNFGRNNDWGPKRSQWDKKPWHARPQPVDERPEGPQLLESHTPLGPQGDGTMTTVGGVGGVKRGTLAIGLRGVRNTFIQIRSSSSCSQSKAGLFPPTKVTHDSHRIPQIQFTLLANLFSDLGHTDLSGPVCIFVPGPCAGCFFL